MGGEAWEYWGAGVVDVPGSKEVSEMHPEAAQGVALLTVPTWVQVMAGGRSLGTSRDKKSMGMEFSRAEPRALGGEPCAGGWHGRGQGVWKQCPWERKGHSQAAAATRGAGRWGGGGGACRCGCQQRLDP